jgi:hypothetical protein
MGMESKIKSSFIPRDTAQPGGFRARKKRGTAGDLLTLFSIVLVIVSVSLGVAVFLYVKFLETSLESKREQLQRAQASFEPALIAELNHLDDRMRTGEDLLELHLAPSVLFRTLEELTLDTVSFRNMQYSAAEKSAINLDISGIARSVNSVALQADLFSKHGTIVNPIFSSIDRQPDGVHFDMTASVNPSNLRFAALVRQALEQVQTEAALPEEPDSIPGFAP